MKKLSALAALACAAALLAACGGDSSSSGPASPPAQTSSHGLPAPSAGVSSVSSGAPVSQAADLATMLSPLVEAAQLGDTIELIELDLKAGGIVMEDVAAWAAAQSNRAGQNGGIVVVVQAAAGRANAVAAQFEGFRDAAMGNEDYAEFEAARTNTSGARIVVNGDYVVYAVSAAGTDDAWGALDAAIAALFA